MGKQINRKHRLKRTKQSHISSVPINSMYCSNLTCVLFYGPEGFECSTNKPFSHSSPCCSNPRLKYANEATDVKTFLARFSVECKQKRQTKISSYL